MRSCSSRSTSGSEYQLHGNVAWAVPEAKPGTTIVLAMEFTLGDDQREIQALARDFAQAEIEPNAGTWDREHGFPRELLGKLGELGLLGVCIPEEYGGAGADFLSYILVLGGLSRAGAGGGGPGRGGPRAGTPPRPPFGRGGQR